MKQAGGMFYDVAELEMLIFGAGCFCFGAEVSQIISVVRYAECSMLDPTGRDACATIQHPVSSIQYVDLSTQLGTRGTTPSVCSADGDGTMALLVETVAGIIGICVDSLGGVVNIPLRQIEPLPEFLRSRMRTDCIWGIGKLQQELVILLDLDRFLPRLTQAVAEVKHI